MKRGKRWRARVDFLYAELVALGKDLAARRGRGEDITEGIARWRALLREYDRLHGAGEGDDEHAAGR
jgi:hypothetical protein